jgi:threonine/homoserine/homoserine lactone efflux protein
MLPVDPALYALFCATMAVFAITPGPSNLFTIATGAAAGPRAALLCVAGMNTASLVWMGAAAAGLGTLAHAFPLAFRIMALAGAAYVAWLGAKSLWSAWRDRGAHSESNRASTQATAFRDGFAVQLSNPKAILFFTAVLPPFMDPARPALPQLALLGATVIAMDVAAMSAYGLGGGALASALERPSGRRAFSLIVGLLLLAVAALIALRD